ncbi:MAG: hypothetical protein JWQ61_137 [Collimonas fungivorans]|nr:hypothetical protein [Collimonas fungivorans]
MQSQPIRFTFFRYSNALGILRLLALSLLSLAIGCLASR